MTVTTAAESATAERTPPRRKLRRFSGRDVLVLVLMVGLPLVLDVLLIWLPVVLSTIFSFTGWNGIGSIFDIEFIGGKNYHNIATLDPYFWPAVEHNLIWIGVFVVLATPFGILLAVMLDRNIKGTRFYQSAFFMPVVLSLALIGFMWQLIYAPDDGFLNNVLGLTKPGEAINWLGNPSINLYAILVAASWRQAGYIMILYLAGLKSFDPALREAAALDGAGEIATFRYVVFPAMKPINIVILVVTLIESLRAFDIAYITNGGRNGLELLSTLITTNIGSEASRIGYGSALAVILLVISLVPICTYLFQTFRREAR
ncbi:MAG TPA: sugar ABC transporter permease [Nocardioidaceae bacterium]|nr:sugar ABC transporter permease [Nocardioidaceae bacterium]